MEYQLKVYKYVMSSGDKAHYVVAEDIEDAISIIKGKWVDSVSIESIVLFINHIDIRR